LNKNIIFFNIDTKLIEGCLFVCQKMIFIFYIFIFLFVIRKVDQRKILLVKKNLVWFSGNCFSFILGGKYFPEVMKNLEILYYWLIISNLVIKLLIDIYFVWFFLISSLKFWFNLIFILILVFIFIFMIVICFSLLIFLIEIFYLSNLILNLLIFLFQIIYEILIIIILISLSFNFFYLLDLIYITLIIIYFIWGNL